MLGCTERMRPRSSGNFVLFGAIQLNLPDASQDHLVVLHLELHRDDGTRVDLLPAIPRAERVRRSAPAERFAYVGWAPPENTESAISLARFSRRSLPGHVVA